MYKLWPTAPRLYCVDRSRWRSHILQPPLHRAVDDLQAVFVQLTYQQQHGLQDVGVLKQVHSQALKFTRMGAWSNAGPSPKHFLRPVYTQIQKRTQFKTKSYLKKRKKRYRISTSSPFHAVLKSDTTSNIWNEKSTRTYPGLCDARCDGLVGCDFGHGQWLQA